MSVNVYNKEIGVELERECTNNHKVTTSLQQFETRSPFVQPYAPQETAQSVKTAMQSVPITGVSKSQVEQLETRPPAVQSYLPQEPLVQAPNIPWQPAPMTYTTEEEVNQTQLQEMNSGDYWGRDG